MAVVLEGGCRVSTMHEGNPQVSGSLKVWNQIGKENGAEAISLRILEFGPGTSPGLSNRESDEVLYLLDESGECTIVIDGNVYDVGPQTGIYLRPGQTLVVENPGPEPVRFVSSQTDSQFDHVVESHVSPIVKLSDRRALPTADRWYRVLVDEEIGSDQVTQFVGSIPPGRAPDHFHEYEEVLLSCMEKAECGPAKQTHPSRPAPAFTCRRDRFIASRTRARVNCDY